MLLAHSQIWDEFDWLPYTTAMNWLIISSSGVVSRAHVDSNGLGTVGLCLTGQKLWVVGTPKAADYLESTQAYSDFQDLGLSDKFIWQPILMTAGSAM